MSYNNPFLLSNFVKDKEAEAERHLNSNQNVAQDPFLSHPTDHSRRGTAQHGASPVSRSEANGYGEDGHDSVESSEDEVNGEEVFYDHQSEIVAWEQEEQQKKRRSAALEESARISTNKAIFFSVTEAKNAKPQSGVSNSVQDASAPFALPPQKHNALYPNAATAERAESSTKRPSVRQYAGVVDAAVATMDHAVSIPSALRGAARRTMFDVLVDVQRRRSAEDKTKTAGERSPNTDAPQSTSSVDERVVVQCGNSAIDATAKAFSGSPSARDATYRMLFPTAAADMLATSARPIAEHNIGTADVSRVQIQPPDLTSQKRATGMTRMEAVLVQSTTSLPLTRDSSGSHFANDSQKGVANARVAQDPPSTEVKGQASPVAATSPSVKSAAPRVVRSSAPSSSSSSAMAGASNAAGASPAPPCQSGPDRRLRHLLPAHLHGSRVSQSLDGDRPTGGIDGRGDADSDALSDISSVTSEGSSAHRTSHDRTGHAAPQVRRHFNTAKDAGLLDVLNGGHHTSTTKEASTRPPLSGTTANTKEVTSTADKAGWLQRIEAAESRAFQLQQQQQQQRHGVRGEGTASTSTKDSRLLEDVLMGNSTQHNQQHQHQHSKQDSKHHRHKQHQHRRKNADQIGRSSSERSRRSRSSDSSRTADTNSSTAAASRLSSSSRSGSRSCSSTSTSSTSLDLMRDLDDDVPQWVRQQEARQQQQQQQLRQSGQGGSDPLSGRFTTAGGAKAAASLERERAEALRPFIGKPPNFYPSCAASGKSRNISAGFGQAASANAPVQRYGNILHSAETSANGSSFLASAARTAGAVFLAGWKEGKRLLKQNPTAMSVVQYLCHSFERWKPYGPALRGVTRPDASTDVERGNHNDNEEADRSNPDASSSAPVRRDAASKDNDVELKICVQYVEAAFNVAVVHGNLTWCSEDARRRLQLPQSAASASQGSAPYENGEEEERDKQHRTDQLYNALPLLSQAARDPLSLNVSDTRWSFLFPEPALMQMPLAVGEHISIAHPYYVYPSTRVVLASYNFTTDAVVRQQEAQFALELEERLRTVAKLDSGRKSPPAAVVTSNARQQGDALFTATPPARHRGVSPARASGELGVSPSDRSPTDLHRLFDFTTAVSATPTHPTPAAPAVAVRAGLDGSPNRMVYEIPGTTRTPQRAGQGIAPSTPDPLISSLHQPPEMDNVARTPERVRTTLALDGRSPDPHPPVRQAQQPQQHHCIAATAVASHNNANGDHQGFPSDRSPSLDWIPASHQNPSQEGDSGRTRPFDNTRRAHDSSNTEFLQKVSPQPSYVRESTVSVHSLSADGFYDPLAMPAFHTSAVTHLSNSNNNRSNNANDTSSRTTGTNTVRGALEFSRKEESTTMVMTGSSVEGNSGTRAHDPHAYTPEAMSHEAWRQDDDGDDATERNDRAESCSKRWRIGAVGAPSATHSLLPPPPPLRTLAGGPTAAVAHPASCAAAPSEVVDVQEDGGPVRTFGSDAAMAEDAVGHGFPRGPPAAWDVPVEVLRVLSGVPRPRAPESWNNLEADKETEATTELNLPQSEEETREKERNAVPQHGRSSDLQPKPLRKRERDDNDAHVAPLTRDSSFVGASAHTDSISIQALSNPRGTVQRHNPDVVRMPSDVSCTFPTPQPSLTQVEEAQSASYAEAEKHNGDDSLSCCSISSPSDISDTPTETDKMALVDLASKPAASRQGPSTRGVPCTRRGVALRNKRLQQHDVKHAQQQQQQQERQDAWMRHLWQQSSEAASTSMGLFSQNPAQVLAPARPASTTLSSAQIKGNVSDSSTPFPYEEQPHLGVEVLGDQEHKLSSPLQALASVVHPHEADAEASSITTGFYALNDVILSDTDE